MEEIIRVLKASGALLSEEVGLDDRHGPVVILRLKMPIAELDAEQARMFVAFLLDRLQRGASRR